MSYQKNMDNDHTVCAATKLEAGKQLSPVERVLKRGTSWMGFQNVPVKWVIKKIWTTTTLCAQLRSWRQENSWVQRRQPFCLQWAQSFLFIHIVTLISFTSEVKIQQWRNTSLLNIPSKLATQRVVSKLRSQLLSAMCSSVWIQLPHCHLLLLLMHYSMLIFHQLSCPVFVHKAVALANCWSSSHFHWSTLGGLSLKVKWASATVQSFHI